MRLDIEWEPTSKGIFCRNFAITTKKLLVSLVLRRCHAEHNEYTTASWRRNPQVLYGIVVGASTITNCINLGNVGTLNDDEDDEQCSASEEEEDVDELQDDGSASGEANENSSERLPIVTGVTELVQSVASIDGSPSDNQALNTPTSNQSAQQARKRSGDSVFSEKTKNSRKSARGSAATALNTLAEAVSRRSSSNDQEPSEFIKMMMIMHKEQSMQQQVMQQQTQQMMIAMLGAIMKGNSSSSTQEAPQGSSEQHSNTK